MADSFFFYDLETSGINPRSARIMQFAGQRTTLDLEPIGEPFNILIRLAPDVLPEPDAIMLTGITPQMTLQDGITEAEFLTLFYNDIVQPGTIFVGYNSVRFDDEFMRFLHYRNFYDPYAWQWAQGCSRWDVLDLVRATRALKPEGIEWPMQDGKPTNRLELLTKANKLSHEQAHDALDDVRATIAIAQLIRSRQPKLFQHYLEQRSKAAAQKYVQSGEPFVYTSGRYSSQFAHTALVLPLAVLPDQAAGVVFDLRYDPTPFIHMAPEALADDLRYKKDRPKDVPKPPFKTMKFNRCPALAPAGVLQASGTMDRLQIDIAQHQKHATIARQHKQQLADLAVAATKLLDADRSTHPIKPNDQNVDSLLYDGFFGDGDAATMRAIRAADASELSSFADKVSDARLATLLPLYKARNFAQALSMEEQAAWQQHLQASLLGGGQRSAAARYFNRLADLAKLHLPPQKEYILTELQLYGESVLPSPDNDQSEDFTG